MFSEAAATAQQIHVQGLPCKVIGLDALITIKESLGRDQDRTDVRALRAIRDRLRNRPAD